MKRFVIAMAIALLTSHAYAEGSKTSPEEMLNIVTSELKACKEKELNDKERLNCYDIATNGAIALSETAKLLKDTTENKPITQTSNSPVEYKVVDSDDVFISPRKYINRPIELRNARCLYADVDEFRCMGAGHMSLVVFTADVTPASAKKALQDQCESLKNVSSSKCKKTLRLVPTSFKEDTLSGYEQRKILRADSVEVITPEPTPARRRR